MHGFSYEYFPTFQIQNYKNTLENQNLVRYLFIAVRNQMVASELHKESLLQYTYHRMSRNKIIHIIVLSPTTVFSTRFRISDMMTSV